MSVTAASNMDVPWRTWPKFSKYTDDRMCRPSSERNEWPVRVRSFRQLLNIAHALKRTARGSGSEAVDWVIHLDHDELFLPPPQGLQAHLRHLDTSDCRLCLYQNFEAVPQDHTLTPFVDVTTFKVPSGRVSKTPAGMAGMNFWAQRTK
ncbi:Kcnq5, partial [Symbiodinium necroappetens]